MVTRPTLLHWRTLGADRLGALLRARKLHRELHRTPILDKISVANGAICGNTNDKGPQAFAVQPLRWGRDRTTERQRLQGPLHFRPSGRGVGAANGRMSSPHPEKRCAVLTGPARELSDGIAGTELQGDGRSSPPKQGRSGNHEVWRYASGSPARVAEWGTSPHGPVVCLQKGMTMSDCTPQVLMKARAALVAAVHAIDAALPPSSTDPVQRIMEMMRAMPERRDLYQSQSGSWFVTYSGDWPPYTALETEQVLELARQGLIELNYPGSYRLAGTKRFDRKGREIQYAADV